MIFISSNVLFFIIHYCQTDFMLKESIINVFPKDLLKSDRYIDKKVIVFEHLFDREACMVLT